MNKPLIQTIHSRSANLQQLKPTEGPTPLVVLYVAIKTLTFALWQTDQANACLAQAWEQLNQVDMSTLLECYQQDRSQAYPPRFRLVQEQVQQAVNQLPEHA